MITLLLLALATDVIRENPNQVRDTREPDQAINYGCAWNGVKLACPLLVGTHVYAVESNLNYVELTNRASGPLSVTKVATANAITAGTAWAEMSVYHDSFGDNCPVPPSYPLGYPGFAPCQKDIDPGPGLRLAGNAGAIYESASRFMPDMTWPGDLNVDKGSFVVLHDNPHWSPATMYTVTVREGPGSLSFRQPKIDWAAYCSGKDEQSAWDPWVADADMTITGAQIYSVGGNGRRQVDGACLYVIAAGPWEILWSLCGDQVRTDGHVSFSPRLVRKGEQIAGHSINRCTGAGVPGSSTWGYVAFITAKRSGP